MLDYDGYTIRCGSGDSATIPATLGISRVTPIRGGFEVAAARLVSSCPYTYASVLVRVSSEDDVGELSSQVLPSSPVCAGRRPEGWLGSKTRSWARGRIERAEASLLAADGWNFVRLGPHILRVEAACVVVVSTLLRTHRRPPLQQTIARE